LPMFPSRFPSSLRRAPAPQAPRDRSYATGPTRQHSSPARARIARKIDPNDHRDPLESRARSDRPARSFSPHNFPAPLDPVVQGRRSSPFRMTNNKVLGTRTLGVFMSFSIRSRHLSLPALALGFAFACSSTPQDGPDGGGGGSTASGGAATGGSSEDPGATGGSPIGGAGAPSGGDSNGGGELPRGDGFHRMEKLDRGVVALVVDGGVYVGFRMHGYEYGPENPGRVAYAVYRDGA